MSIPALYYPYSHSFPFAWEDILRLEGQGNYTVVVLVNGKQYLTSKSLCIYEPHVPEWFMRVHKHCFINACFVRHYDTRTNSVVLQNGTAVSVSRRRSNWVKQQLQQGISQQ